MADSPLPDLQVRPFSGLTFPWAEYQPGSGIGTGTAHLGTDIGGVVLEMKVMIFWEDLTDAVQEMLGYSWRDTSTGTPVLRRVIPWQHPYFNQLFVKAITSVQGVQLRGTNVSDPVDFFAPLLGGVGAGFLPNGGPWSEFYLAILTVQFWRPPYYIRTDEDILDEEGDQQEWLRYLDKHWSFSAQVLHRNSSSAKFFPGQGVASNKPFVGGVGQVVSHAKISRRWYQIPEAALFEPLNDFTLNGIPQNLLYTLTPTTNPITLFVYTKGSPILGTVNSPIGGGIVDDPDKRFLGFPMGTLRLESIEIVPVPLQLPPYLMNIPVFSGNEAISQQQYDVVFHFDYFDPPRAPSGAGPLGLDRRGHNLVPYTGDGMWYVMHFTNAVEGTATTTTMFQYSDMTDLFFII